MASSGSRQQEQEPSGKDLIRVALIANSSTPGGAESYLYRLYSGLVSQGRVQVTLIGSLPNWPQSLGAETRVGVAAKLTRQKPILPQLRNSIGNALAVRRELAKQEYDLIHMQYVREKLVLGKFFTRRLPVVWTEHGPLAPNFPRMGLPLLRARATNAKIIAVSAAVKDSLDEVGIDSVTVWNPLPEQNGEHLLRSRDGEQSRFVLYAGRVHESKRLDILLKAADLVPKLTVKIAGDGPDLERLRGVAPKNVEFLGHLEDLHEPMAGCLAVVSTSGRAAREGSPMVVLEARNMGVPVLMAADCHAANEARALGASIYEPTADGLASELRALGMTIRRIPLTSVERMERGEMTWLNRTYDVMRGAVKGSARTSKQAQRLRTEK